jgi:hypothetical protein
MRSRASEEWAHGTLRRSRSTAAEILYMRLSGVPRLLISDESLREKQEHMVTVTLADLYRAYAPP